MTREIYNELEKYEQHLKTAKYCDYVRNVTSTELSVLNGIYKILFGKDSKLGNGCSKCQLKDYKKIADAYFEYKERMAKEAEEAETEQVEQVEEIEPVKKPRKSRKTDVEE